MRTPPDLSRRRALRALVFGAGGVGLRALATGLPVSFLMNPRRALAADECTLPAKAQYVIFNTSSEGDSINAHVPGTYADSKIVHSPDPSMAATQLTLSGRGFTAGKPWASLPQAVLDRTSFWHLMTDTPIHPKEVEVLKLMGAAKGHEMLPSLLAKGLAPCLGTVQPQPVSIGGAGPSEALSYDGAVLPTIPPLALKDTLTSASGQLLDLMPLRDQTLKTIHALYKTAATPAQRAFIDNLTLSQAQVRSLNQSLLSALAALNDNSVASQITAAVAMIQLNLAPVITIHIPFGGDNHADDGLEKETAQTVSGVASIASLMAALQSAGLQDKVTFMSLNVFGRTLYSNGGQSALTGRTHNGNHQVSLAIGKPFRGGVVGGVVPVGTDIGAQAIDSTSGAADASGDVAARDTLGAFAKTMLAAVGGDPALVTRGKVIAPALA